MTGLTMLWLPILVSAVLVFAASSVIHMMSPWHKTDFPKMPRESEVMDALRPFAIPPGDYFVPRPSGREELRSPEFADRVAKGPVVVMTVLPNAQMPMGRNLMLWFAYIVVVGVFAAYVAGRALPPGASYVQVFRFAAATSFIGYSLALWQLSMWYRGAGMTTLKANVD